MSLLTFKRSIAKKGVPKREVDNLRKKEKKEIERERKSKRERKEEKKR